MTAPDSTLVRPQVQVISILCVMLCISFGGQIGNGFQPRATGPLSVGEGVGLVIGTLAGVVAAALISRPTLLVSPLYGLTFVGAKLGDRLGREGASAWVGWLAGGLVGFVAGLALTWLVGKLVAPEPNRIEGTTGRRQP